MRNTQNYPIYPKFAKSALKSEGFAFFASNRADNPNIFCNFAAKS
jgi:hypothetical protein